MKNITLVFGAGLSGVAAANLLIENQKNVVIFEGNANFDTAAFYEKYPHLQNVRIFTQELPKDVDEALSLVVLSPGVPTDLPMVLHWKNRRIPIIGEIELAYRLGKGDVVGITGTNGKTTTTALCGAILKEAFLDVLVVGNIGIPYTEVVKKTKEDTKIVAEISSFQLETIQRFHPRVCAILNITPDHLDRHHTMEAYAKAKGRIAENQTAEDTCVLNYDDEILRSFASTVPSRVVFFTSKEKLKEGIYLDGEQIVMAKGDTTIPVIQTNELQILGMHNYENAMAAIAIADALGVPMEKIIHALKNFQSVEHRIEFVCEKNGVVYYNDSKGTNPDAAIKGIEAMTRPTILIGGGYDKQADYTDWVEHFAGKVKKLILLGATRDAIADSAKEVGFFDIVFVDSMEEAVRQATEIAAKGDAVLLSPACASWGMYKNYEERGRDFKELVKRMA